MRPVFIAAAVLAVLPLYPCGAAEKTDCPSDGSPAVRRVITFVPESNPEGKVFGLDEVAGKLAPEMHPPVFNPKEEHSATGTGDKRTSNCGNGRTDVCRSGKAYSKDGDLYVCGKKITSATEGICYGTAVSRNEFGIDGGIFWSPDSNRVAFYRKDESRVKEFELFDIKSLESTKVRYPMAGCTSENISLGIYDIEKNSTVYLKTDACYICTVCWSPDSRFVYAMTGSRNQHDWNLEKFDSVDGQLVKRVLSEHNDAWVEPYDVVHFLPGGKRFIYSSDNRDGCKSLYLCNDNGIVRRLSTGGSDAVFEGFSGKYIYYTGRGVSPANPQLYRIDFTDRKAEPEMLSNGYGSHRTYFEGDGYVDCFSAVGNAGWVVRCDLEGNVRDTLRKNSDPLEGYARCGIEYGTVKSADGRFDNRYRLIRPLGFDPSKKYPLLVYVYGGPHLQMVKDEYMVSYRNWEMYMAQRGYVVYVQDNRGTPWNGTEYEKAVNRRLGREEMRDQMVGIGTLLKEDWIDTSRVGVAGWSFGGFMTISLMTEYPDIFAAGACGGPVTDWKWYEVMYGERYMDTPETNPEGFAVTGLIDKADRLQAPLLICQGGMDTTVLPLNALNFVQSCIEKGKVIEYMPYPCSGHNVSGDWRMQMYDTITSFFDKNL